MSQSRVEMQIKSAVRFSQRAGFLAGMVLLSSISGAFGQGYAEQLRIDIPTKLEKANVVVDFGHAAFNGDMPFALGDIGLLARDMHAWNTKGIVVMIFHGDAAYMILNDETYDANRHATGGNPYKKILNDLMAQGVQLELCGATAKGNHWVNSNLLPGVKVNVNAMVRVTQLEQDGYTLIYQ
jgi:intracellular sulfur oxidation DsrE/DsrF family protein